MSVARSKIVQPRSDSIFSAWDGAHLIIHPTGIVRIIVTLGKDSAILFVSSRDRWSIRESISNASEGLRLSSSERVFSSVQKAKYVLAPCPVFKLFSFITY